jgi:hypothetical protein
MASHSCVPKSQSTLRNRGTTRHCLFALSVVPSLDPWKPFNEEEFLHDGTSLRTKRMWSAEDYKNAHHARSLKRLLKPELLHSKRQSISGRSRRGCVIFIHRCVQQKPLRRSWTEEEIDQIPELRVGNPTKVVVRKVGHSTSFVRHLHIRQGIRIKKLRCAPSQATAAMHVRKSQIGFWLD